MKVLMFCSLHIYLLFTYSSDVGSAGVKAEDVMMCNAAVSVMIFLRGVMVIEGLRHSGIPLIEYGHFWMTTLYDFLK